MTVSRETVAGCYLCRLGCCGQHQRDPDVDRDRAEQLVQTTLPQAARPWSPRRTVTTSDGRVPECYGRFGYGAGLLDAGQCSRGRCSFSDRCFTVLRQLVEARDPRAQAFNDLHSGLTKVARDAGEASPGHAAMQVIKGMDVPRPFEDAVRGNNDLGRLDSGEWAYCSDCTLIALKDVMVAGRCPGCADG